MNGLVSGLRVAAATALAAVVVGVGPSSALAAEPPTVTLDPSPLVFEFNAAVSGTIDPEGSPTTYHFEYSRGGSNVWHWFPGPDGDPGTHDEHSLDTAATGPVGIFEAISELEANTTYSVRLVATNDAGTRGAQLSFHTLSASPTIESTWVSDVGPTSVTLNAQIHPRNSETTYHFEYGPTNGYGSVTPEVHLPASGSTAVSAVISGLEPSTDYSYRVVVDGSDNAWAGEGSFTTATLPALVSVTGVSDLTSFSATVSGTVDPRGGSGFRWFSVAEVRGFYSSMTPVLALDTTAGLQQVVGHLPALPSGREFEVRLHASTAGGIRSSDPLRFSTPARATPPQAPAAAVGTRSRGRFMFSLPSNRFSVQSSVRGKRARISVAVPGKGLVTMRGARVASVVERAKGKGIVTLRTKLTRKARRTLRQSKTGRLRAVVRLTYRPAGGVTREITRTLRFRRQASR